MTEASPPRDRDRWGRPVPHGDVSAFDPGVDTEAPRTPADAIRVAQALVDAGSAFWAHEVFEAQWRSRPDAERDLWQGLAQVCVVLTHEGRGNQVGADRVAARAVERLSTGTANSAAATLGIDLAPIRAWLSRRDGTEARLAP
jgi:hypothetical protein